jgi:serine/threonine protein kinase
MSPPMTILTGQFIGQGRLQLLEVLGNGAYGTVYRALDTDSIHLEEHIYYAVKVLIKPTNNSKRSEVKRSEREFAMHHSVCDHPNVLSVYDIISDDTYIYVVLALCPGGDLYEAIATRHAYHKDVELTRLAILQLIDAVHHCNEKRVFHRDLKPENILCSPDGSKLYLTDFGLSTRKEFSKEFGCGTAHYMSPG